MNVNKLNLQMQSLLNDPSKRKDNSFAELLEIASYDYYNSEFLIHNDISVGTTELSKENKILHSPVERSRSSSILKLIGGISGDRCTVFSKKCKCFTPVKTCTHRVCQLCVRKTELKR